MFEQLITSSVLILAVCFLRVLFEKRVNACMLYALWLVVAVKLLVPLPALPTGFGVLQIADRIVEHIAISGTGSTAVSAEPSDPDVSAQPQTSDISVADMDSSDQTNAVNAGMDSANTANEQTPAAQQTKAEESSIPSILFIVWGIGAGAAAAVFIGSNLLFLRRLRKSCRFAGYFYRLSVYETPVVATPCLYGLLCPGIYVQEYVDPDEDGNMRCILTHEYTHFCHGDGLWALVRCVCVIVYWYDPFVWLAAFISMRDCELACDEGAIRRLGEENRTAYGKMLIEMLAHAGRLQRFTVSAGVADSMHGMKKRIQHIAEKTRTRASAAVVLAGCCVVLTGCTFSGSRPADTETEVTEAVSEPEAEKPTETAEEPETETSEVIQQYGWSWKSGTVTAPDGTTYTVGAGAIGEADGCIDVSIASETDVYFTYYGASSAQLIVEYTHDGGVNWEKTNVTVTEYGYDGYTGIGTPFLSFLPDGTGYLLYCSDPGAGQMGKLLLVSHDGGASFEKVSDLSDTLHNYPTGIAFCEDNKGMILTQNHGDAAGLFLTEDGGKTWTEYYPQPLLASSQLITYFDGISLLKLDDGIWKLTIAVTDSETREKLTLYSADNWETWDTTAKTDAAETDFETLAYSA